MSKDSKLESEVGETKEAKIAAMIAIGLSRTAIQAAMEDEHPETIREDDSRRKDRKLPQFNKIVRQRMLESIRSTYKQMKDKREEREELMEFMSDASSGMSSIDETDLSNLRRFSCGVPALDMIYGNTHFIWLADHPQGKYKRGEYMPNWVPQSVADRGHVLDEVIPTDRSWTCSWEDAYIEHGMPQSFLSTWPGEPGVGKSRLAIAVTKTLNKLGHKVCYYNGEAEKTQFRTWCGSDVNKDLFLCDHVERVKLEQIVADAYKFQPKVIVVDSFQTIAEVSKNGNSTGTLTTLSRLKLLKNDEAAGKPHIIFISQLNKKGDMSGTKKIPHMVDFVASIKKLSTHKGCFIFECPDKNRGGETGKGALFRHGATTVECISMDYMKGPLYRLIQPGATATVAATPPIEVATGLNGHE